MAQSPFMTDSSAGSKKSGAEYFWVWVLCVLGLDYFSTLAYQPSITFHETGLLGPIATAAIVLLTLFGALPVYCYLAGRSPGGQGSLGILEKLIRGWRGKTLVLILLGFAATDFTMLKSLSLADAAVHVLNKQDGMRLEGAKHVVGWVKECTTEYCGDETAQHVTDQLIVTILLGIIATIFWFLLRKGFTRNVMIFAVPLVGLYLLMSGVVIAAGAWFLYQNPLIVTDWLDQVMRGELHMAGARPQTDGWLLVILLSFLALPKLALGLSGFEMSMILMPQVQGKPGEQPPATRIRNTRKVLFAAAVIMSLYLLGSSLVTTLLIPESQFAPREHAPDAGAPQGLANDRALAYLAHGGGNEFNGDQPLSPIFGSVFGTLYDIVTVLILCLAGTSVVTALGVLLPVFLLRFGMEFKWAERWGILLIAFAAINLLVTIAFQAKVEDQRGAYATGVLVMIACASMVTAVEHRHAFAKASGTLSRLWRFSTLVYFALIAVIFLAVMLAVALRSASGLAISLLFIAAILGMSILSRAWRADELRTIGYAFKDTQSEFLWNSLRLADFPILVPVRPGRDTHRQKEQDIRTHHNLSADADIVLLEVCVDDPSDFFQTLAIEVVREDNRFVIKVTNCVSAAHAIAAIALEMSRSSKPPGLHFGWPEMDMLSGSWSYLAFGEGNIPWKVRELIHRAEKDPAKRPRVIVG
jgi:hypothetical protein